MVESLRARLLIWHLSILAIVIVTYGGALCYLTWRSRLIEVDAALTSRALELEQALQQVADDTFDLILPAETDGGDVPLTYHVLRRRSIARRRTPISIFCSAAIPMAGKSASRADIP
jgi:hypothetical protein